MATPHMPFFEFLPAELCESRLRKELTRDELVFEDGALAPPRRPGLGIDVDRDALDHFAAAARGVGQLPLVAAVHPPRHRAASCARCLAGAGPG